MEPEERPLGSAAPRGPPHPGARLARPRRVPLAQGGGEEAWDGVLRIAPREAVRGGHGVLLVGYRDDPTRSGGGFFIARNSGKVGRDGLMTYEHIRTCRNDEAWIDSGLDAPPPGPPAPKVQGG